MSIVDKVSHLTWKKYLKKKTPQFMGASIITALLVLTIILSEGIDLSIDTQNLDPQYMLLIIVSSLAFLVLLAAILKLFLFNNLEGMGIKSDDRGLEVIRLLFFTGMIMSFVTGLYCLLDVSLPDAYLQMGPIFLVRLALNTTNSEIDGLSELVGTEFYQTARNGIFAIVFFGTIIFFIIALIAVITKVGRNKMFQLLKRSETFSELIDDEVTKSDITLVRMILFVFLPILIYFILTEIQGEEALIFLLGGLVLIIAGIIWLYIFYKIIDDLLLKGVKFAPKVILLNVLLISPVLFCFWILPLLLASFNEVLILNNGSDLEVFLSFFAAHLVDLETIIIYDFILCVAFASVFIGMAEGAMISSFMSAIKNGVEIPQSGKVSQQQAPKSSIWTKYTLLIGVWINVLLVNLRPIWETLKAIIFFDWPEFPFPNLFDWIKNSLISLLEQFIESQLAVFVSILVPLLLLTIPLYFILTTSFKFLSISLYTSRVKSLSAFTALITTALVLVLVEILSDLWAMQATTDVPLRVLNDTAVFSNTMEIVQLFEAVFFFFGIPLGVYLIIRRSPWKGTKVVLDEADNVS